MYVIIVGCGEVGAKLAELLSREGHNVVVTDQLGRSFLKLGGTFNGLTIVGSGADSNILKEAGVEKADALVAVTGSDNANIMASQIARDIFKVPRVIARVYDPKRAQLYQEMGMDIISGTILLASMIRDRIVESELRTYPIRSKDLELIEIKVGEKLTGKRVAEVRREGEFQIIAIVRKSGSVIPRDEDLLEAGERLLGVVRTKDFERIREMLEGQLKPKLGQRPS